MVKIFKINAAILSAIKIVVIAPGAFAGISDLQKAAVAANASAQAPMEKAWSLSGATFENSPPLSSSEAISAEHKSGFKRLELKLAGRSQAPRSSSISKPSKSAGGAPGGRWGLFKMGYNAGFTAFMIPPAAAAQIPYVGDIASVAVGIPCMVLGAVAGIFMGAYRAFFGEGS